MQLLRQNLKGYTKQVVLGPLFKLLEAILELFVPMVVANMIDLGVSQRNTGYLLRSGLILLVLAVAGVVSAIICQYYAAVAAGHFGRSLRAQVYAHTLLLSGSEVAEVGPGGLVTRLTNDTFQIQHSLNLFIRLGTRAPFLVTGGLIMALVMNWRIGLIFLGVTPLIGLTLFLIMRRSLPGYGRVQAGQDALARLAGENLAGARVIRAFSRQKAEAAQFTQDSDDLSREMVRVGRLSALLNPVTALLVSFALAGILWLGGALTNSGASSPGQVFAMVSYMNQILLAMVVGSNLIVLFTRGLASGKRLATLLGTQTSVTDGPGAVPNADAPAIEFKNVGLAYHPGADAAVSGLSFSIPRGATVGVIGGTGSGKSTLAALIARQYDATEGQVQVAGHDVRQYTLHGLRALLGVVPQRAALFTGSIRRNLCMAAPTAGDNELWRALHTAQADFVQRLPQGLDSEVAEGGKNFSGGQQQRLTIARALLRRPEILILDDSASALDYATDAALRKALKADASPGRTTLIISQRAFAMRHADVILVLDDGRLAGMGSHAQLLAENSVYREICASQGLPAEGRAAT